MNGLYDVVVYRIDTRIIDKIVGVALRLNDGRFTAETRLATVAMRLNDAYNAAIVPAGSVKPGDTLPVDE